MAGVVKYQARLVSATSWRDQDCLDFYSLAIVY
jgi:hypothetical protein